MPHLVMGWQPRGQHLELQGLWSSALLVQHQRSMRAGPARKRTDLSKGVAAGSHCKPLKLVYTLLWQNCAGWAKSKRPSALSNCVDRCVGVIHAKPTSTEQPW